jgi:hypothetical protein
VACHSERSEESSESPPRASTVSNWILHCVQNDKRGLRESGFAVDDLRLDFNLPMRNPPEDKMDTPATGRFGLTGVGTRSVLNLL